MLHGTAPSCCTVREPPRRLVPARAQPGAHEHQRGVPAVGLERRVPPVVGNDPGNQRVDLLRGGHVVEGLAQVRALGQRDVDARVGDDAVLDRTAQRTEQQLVSVPHRPRPHLLGEPRDPVVDVGRPDVAQLPAAPVRQHVQPGPDLVGMRRASLTRLSAAHRW